MKLQPTDQLTSADSGAPSIYTHVAYDTAKRTSFLKARLLKRENIWNLRVATFGWTQCFTNIVQVWIRRQSKARARPGQSLQSLVGSVASSHVHYKAKVKPQVFEDEFVKEFNALNLFG